MDAAKLIELGFSLTAGKIDYQNVNYGEMSLDGPVLTEAGQALVAQLSGVAPARGRRKKAEVADEPAAEAADE